MLGVREDGRVREGNTVEVTLNVSEVDAVAQRVEEVEGVEEKEELTLPHALADPHTVPPRPLLFVGDIVGVPLGKKVAELPPIPLKEGEEDRVEPPPVEGVNASLLELHTTVPLGVKEGVKENAVLRVTQAVAELERVPPALFKLGVPPPTPTAVPDTLRVPDPVMVAQRVGGMLPLGVTVEYHPGVIVGSSEMVGKRKLVGEALPVVPIDPVPP